MIDDKWIAHHRALCEAATPGPWQRRFYDGNEVETVGDNIRVATFNEARRDTFHNARFIADARTAMPEALEEIERLRALRCDCDEDAPGGHAGDCVTQLPAIAEAQSEEIERLRAEVKLHADSGWHAAAVAAQAGLERVTRERDALRAEVEAMRPGRFTVGQRVTKPKGYRFDSVIVAVFRTTTGEVRVVAENGDRLLHIFNEDQLEAHDAALAGAGKEK